eukprot:TRINITY_DN1326_c0_g2_i3.p2 TRINITY_DN1326_c0_g2~~TRINITY_DN1326_c0_g2_i3.p2  ORF type:complete len:160 (-),score=29.80 TRINITY_DN1326_c0_g2_i3:373-852(-)
MFLYPNVIMPLFNKYEELEAGELKQKIEELANKVKYPLKRIYVVDASKRSSHSNAYLYGFGANKRIVLFDTLLNSPHEQIVAILCTLSLILGHELGHWKYMHTLKFFCITVVHLLILFFLFGQFKKSPLLFDVFGFKESSVRLALWVDVYWVVVVYVGV